MEGEINNQTSLKSIKDKILEAAKNGQIKMRPRWHFALKAALAVTGSIILLVTLLYLVSLISFMMHHTGTWFVPIFGFKGFYALFLSLPWFLIILSIIFAAILETLVQRYSFAYRRPLFYSLLGILLIAVVGGFIVSRTPLHPNLFRYSQAHDFPVAGGFYRGIEQRRPPNIHKGNITDFVQSGFVIKNFRGDSLIIIITPRTRLPYGADFNIGDSVVVFGERAGMAVQAFGVLVVEKEF